MRMKILLKLKKILIYFRKNTADNLKFNSELPDMSCMKKVYTDKKALFHWSAARKKERFSSRL